MSDLIDLAGVTKVYRTQFVETHALRGVDVKIGRGEYVSIAGVSGSGKSTLLYILGLLSAPSSGQYLFDGQNMAELSIDERARIRNRKIGFVFQNYNLIDELTVLENVRLPFKYRSDGKQVPHDYIDNCIARLGLAHRASHYPRELSGGQQQRVAIARALATNPLMLLLDEPTGSLDSQTRDELLNLLDEILSPTMTIINVTHDETCATRSRRSLHMTDGQLAG